MGHCGAPPHDSKPYHTLPTGLQGLAAEEPGGVDKRNVRLESSLIIRDITHLELFGHSTI